MSQWYKVSLLPLAPYFFGQELGAELGNKHSYYQFSSIFPQQSTLLGLIRHQILLQHGIATPPMVDAKEIPTNLVSNVGFKPEYNKKNYGKIKKISPVFLQNNNEGHYFPSTNEYVNIKGEIYKLEPDVEIEYNSLTSASMGTIKLKCTFGNVTKPYSLKHLFHEYLSNISGTEKVDLSNVIRTASQVGVYKHSSRGLDSVGNTEAYFKRDYINLGLLDKIDPSICENKGIDDQFHTASLDHHFQLLNEWSFAFYVEMEDNTTLSSTDYRVAILGKEQSTFLIRITDKSNEINTSWLNQDSIANGINKIVLLSDAYLLEQEIIKNTLLINGSTVRFRSFSRDLLVSNNFSKLHFKDKSDSYTLLKRGSVIYTKSAIELKNLFDLQTGWRTIGYNHFITK